MQCLFCNNYAVDLCLSLKKLLDNSKKTGTKTNQFDHSTINVQLMIFIHEFLSKTAKCRRKRNSVSIIFVDSKLLKRLEILQLNKYNNIVSLWFDIKLIHFI